MSHEAQSHEGQACAWPGALALSTTDGVPPPAVRADMPNRRRTPGSMLFLYALSAFDLHDNLMRWVLFSMSVLQSSKMATRQVIVIKGDLYSPDICWESG